MRWPGSGRPGRRGDKGVSGTDGSGARRAPDPSAREHAAEPPAWRTLPPVTSAWSGSAPLLNPGGTAPLVSTPLVPGSAAAQPTDGPGAPAPGRVVGLTTNIRPPHPATHEPVQPPEYLRAMPPLRHAPTRALVDRPPLTAATDEFVGEPLAPPAPEPPPAPAPAPAAAPPPFRPTQFSERPDPPVEASTEAGARFREALANLHKSGLPRYEPGVPSPESGAPPAPPAAPQPPAPPTDGAEPPAGAPGGAFRPPSLTHRRSLAESRRLGLGAPMREVPTPEQVLDTGTRPESLADALESAAAVPPPAMPAIEAPAAAAPVPAPPAVAPAPVPAPAPSPAPSVSDDDAPPPADGPTSGGGGLRTTPVVRPISDPTVRPTASTTPLVFRSGERRFPQPPERTGGVPRAVVTRAPTELARALSSSHGIDVADVPIKQDAEATHEAGRRRARGFTRAATVHLPEQVDVLSSGPGRALLAHELVHAAQQRRLGGALPAEDTPEGRALEQEALDAERAYGGSPSEWRSSEPLRHAPRTAAVTSGDGTQHARWDDEPDASWESENSLSDSQVREIKFHVARMITDRGSSLGGGAGGGGLGGADLSKTAVGTWKARDRGEFRKQIIDAYNLELQMQGMPTVTEQTMDPTLLSEIDAQFDAAERERIALKDKQDALKQHAAENEAELKKHKEKLDGVEKKAKDTKLRTVDGSAVDEGSWKRPGVEEEEKDAAAPKAAPGAGLVALSSLSSPGAGSGPKKDDDVRLTEVEKLALDPDPEVTSFKVRTKEEFYSRVLDAYNLERQMQGMDPVAALTSEERDEVYAQFDTAREAVLSARMAKAQADDARKAREAQLLEEKKRTLAAAGASGETTATSVAPVTQTASAPTTETAGEARPAAAAEAPAASEDNITYEKLEQFAERIYDRVRTRLRAELLIDRERSGMPINR